MSISELIGFIITIIAMFGILISRAFDAKKRRTNPEAYEKKETEREKRLRRLLGNIDTDFPTKKAPPPLPPKREEPLPIPESSLLENEAYQIRKTPVSRLKKMIRNPRDLIIFKEVMTPYDPFR